MVASPQIDGLGDLTLLYVPTRALDRSTRRAPGEHGGDARL